MFERLGDVGPDKASFDLPEKMFIPGSKAIVGRTRNAPNKQRFKL